MSWSQVDALRWIVNHPLNREHRAAALLRWATAQLRARIGPACRLAPFVDETQLYIGRGQTAANMQHYTGLGEPDVMAFLMHFLRPDDLFVDVGANTGVMTVLAGGVTGASVMAFEPDEETFGWLKRNVSANGLESRVRCYAMAVADTAGEMRLTKGLGAENRAARPGEDAAQRVACVRLDTVLEDAKPTVLKVDVEGFETPVLSGAERVLDDRSLQAAILELKGHGRKYGFDESDLRAKMERAGFLPFSYDGLTRALIPFGQVRRRPANTIFLRDPEAAMARLSGAPKRRLIWDQMI